jgi:hypothetical protein
MRQGLMAGIVRKAMISGIEVHTAKDDVPVDLVHDIEIRGAAWRAWERRWGSLRAMQAMQASRPGLVRNPLPCER